MKNDAEVWVVVEEGKHVSTGIPCELGKAQAKELRKEMTKKTGRSWTSKKTTQKEIATV